MSSSRSGLDGRRILLVAGVWPSRLFRSRGSRGREPLGTTPLVLERPEDGAAAPPAGPLRRAAAP